MILSPRKVMHAMDQYIPNFNLTRQQDAAEALHHLLSSLQDETSESYVPNYGSLAELSAFPHCKILHPNRKSGPNEQERWQQDLLGPFNGILGSSLTCKSCSSQLSADFEFFISLPLTPLINGCSVEHCLKQFTAAELIDNYRCNRCWHIAGIKYFSTVDGNHKAQIEKLNSCVEEDTCECRNLFPEEVPWSHQRSRTLKQLSIVRCPKILCIHLQRASMNPFGELVKFQGHIPFPMLLDLSPYIKPVAGVSKESLGENLEMREVNQHNLLINRFNIFNHQFPMQMMQQLYAPVGDDVKIQSKPLVADEIDETNYSVGDTSIPETGASHTEGVSYPVLKGSLAHRTSVQTDENMNISFVRDVMDVISDSSDSEYVLASRIESDDNHSEDCEMMESPIQPIHGHTGESNLNTSSKPLVEDAVGIGNDSVDGKHPRSSLKESDVGSTEGYLPLQQIHGQNEGNQNIPSEPIVVDLLGNTTDPVHDRCDQTMKAKSGLDSSEGSCPEFTNNMPLQRDGKINNKNHVVSSKSHMYRLVSVVEHFGRVGSGHYTVYRRVKRSSDDSDSAEQLGSSKARWFCVSDTDVWGVSEKAVLAADASLLFYERVEEFS
ncbi:ubiquitin carboxyl-terminal hydrolase 27-like isoform X2 [Papaver somniferum]|nr:ubiquitin carboxyl-terminal hydrolase 27-like isoform X2 [Papaver somniferum]